MAVPVTDADRDRVRALHAQGKTRNDIAREIGRSPSTVSKLAHAAGLSFDRTKTAAATAAKQRDNQARRADLVGRLYGRGEAILDRVEAPRYKFTTATVNGIETKALDHVPAQEEKALATAVSSHLAAAAKLEAVDTDRGTGAVRSMIGSLAHALGVANPIEDHSVAVSSIQK
ncbi:helix-turn-helix domain-containing protein [Saccharopolyspora shandongensis]|uniref:helix-turn-helix domain-containing protein n=1 Tax=Saccharopolyspora shandongensis TaxID=418495 RepID=UPI0033DC1456